MIVRSALERTTTAILTAVVAAAVGLTCQPARAQTPDEIDPTGGLRSRGMVPVLKPPASTREELIRKWDLDGNGTIDASEASIARARMRRARMQLELDGGLDPVTGKPRMAVENDAASNEPAEDVEVSLEPIEDDRRPAKETTIPGTRVPDAPSVTSGTTTAAPKTPTPATSGTAAAKQPATVTARSGSVTGGVRAGAPAASAGYGARGPKPDLNAGMPKPVRPAPSTARGGLLPSARPAPAPRPTTPAAPSRRPPPVTADEIGGF